LFRLANGLPMFKQGIRLGTLDEEIGHTVLLSPALKSERAHSCGLAFTACI
jgi:hypothetical protein